MKKRALVKKRKLVVMGLVVCLLAGVMTGCGKTGGERAGKEVDTGAEALVTQVPKAPETTPFPSVSPLPDNSNKAKFERRTPSEGLLDLTKLSSVVVFSEVANMMYAPEEYIGREVKMKGKFAVYEREKRNYYACIVADAAACCKQGVEFTWEGDHVYPDEYPKDGQEIEVEGIFSTYEEDGSQFWQLDHAKMRVI